MQNDHQMADREFLIYAFVDCAVNSLKSGWSHKAPLSWTWTTRSELELLTKFYQIAFASGKKIIAEVQEILFEVDFNFTKPELAAKLFWKSLEASFDTPWDKSTSKRMRIAKNDFETRVRQLQKALSPQKTTHLAAS